MQASDNVAVIEQADDDGSVAGSAWEYLSACEPPEDGRNCDTTDSVDFGDRIASVSFTVHDAVSVVANSLGDAGFYGIMWQAREAINMHIACGAGLLNFWTPLRM